MKNYSAMSDFEINLAVVHILLGKGNYDWDSEFQEVYLEVYMGDRFDPCNNPSDAWTIIVDNKISLNPRCANDEWKAQVRIGKDDIFDNYASCWDRNPLRSAMIVYLMMKEVEE